MADETLPVVPVLTDREILVRIDTKLDGVIEDKKDHEARLRVVETDISHLKTSQVQQDEAAKSYLTPKHLWVGAGGMLAATGGIIAVVHTVWRW